MITLFTGLLHRVILITALGLITVSFSELWFYPMALTPALVELGAVYGLMGLIFAISLARFRVGGIAGLFAAAGLFGFIAEGVPVTELYRSLPFTILWTSLAWHALLTVCVGLILYRRIMARGGWIWAASLNAVIGTGLGIWGGYIWNSSGLGWAPVETFGAQFLVGYGAFMLGHFLLDRLAPLHLPSGHHEYQLWLGLAGLAYLLQPLLAAFPVSLAFLPLVGVSIWALHAQRGTGKLAILSRLERDRIPLKRYATSLILPATALAAYVAATTPRTGYEANAWLILTAGPLAALLWARSLAAIFIRR
ncbi:hypothetical protein [Actibacterium sp. 188UL27-1]|uniref:hypothetical protein n=1 Tax=Actibacterium sp. 188UL27-1 TaxID=2786961 RepID=UPI00195D670E|nr:hypothetical protein [Actibacterium sp. 188UL27-1]MBM7066185.1 hypothetical protein [Actibacterium sp. 188UL27-1]